MEGKPGRPVPPKPAPYVQQTPLPSAVPLVLTPAHHTPSSGASPVTGRKPPPSGAPPPPPPRVDLGEAPGGVVCSLKENRSDGITKKGSPKLKAKGKPEITIVSARPMDTPGVIPPPSAPRPQVDTSGVLPAPSAPNLLVQESEEPKVPQRPGRRSKGREPPPRPKTRPVSELTDEQHIAPVIPGEGISTQVTPGKREEGKTNEDSDLKRAALVPSRKVLNHNMDSNLEEKLELNNRVESKEVVEDKLARSIAGKATVIDTKHAENESGSPVEVDGVIETAPPTSSVPAADAATTAKKNKPTVILSKSLKKSPSPLPDSEEKQGNKSQKEANKEDKQLPLTNQGGKPPTPAKKPKPAVKPKPISVVETPSKETVEDKKLDTSVAPKPKPRPTVILPSNPAKVTEGLKPSLGETETTKDEGESKAQVKPSRPTVILPHKPKLREEPKSCETDSVNEKEKEAVQGKLSKPTVISRAKPSQLTEASKPTDDGNECERADIKPVSDVSMRKGQEGGKDQEQTLAPQSVKPKRVPTVIRAQRPEGQDAGEMRKAPKRPQRGPSVRKPAPPRPVSAPSEEKEDQDSPTPSTQEESGIDVFAQVTDKKQEKSPKPQRPVSMDAQRSNDVKALVKGESALNRKGSKKRLAPPRPPAAVPHRLEVEPTNVPDKTFKEKHQPPPPRPPTAEPVEEKVDPTSNTRDETEEKDGKATGKNKPLRPPSKVLDSKYLPEETNHSRVDKPKPARPAPVAPKIDAANRNEAETRTIGETSAGGHVKGTCDARDSEGPENASKAKQKPPRPASSSFSSKKKPHRPSGPTAQPSKKAKEETAPTQVSSVCETYIEPSAIALYDYEPTAIDDLAFNAGDEIVLVKKIDSDWYIGRLGDQQGMFPVKFVEIIEDLHEDVAQESQPTTTPASSPFDVMALYDFHGNEHDGELVFTAGEIIHVTEKVNNDWLRGEYHGQNGAFPCNFVDISEDTIKELPLNEAKMTSSARKGKEKEEMTSPNSALGLRCKALFDYNSDVLEDLSFHTGDVIIIHKKTGDEWFEGELKGRVGLFPSAYVEVIEDSQGSQPEKTKISTVEFGTALYEFTGSASDELSFTKGDKIEIIEVISDDWLRGRMGSREGMFPRTFVQLSKESVGDKPQLAQKNAKVTPKAKALFDFDGEFDDELSFKVDDIIILLERVNEEWLKGEVNNRVGRFPATFVEVLTPLH